MKNGMNWLFAVAVSLIICFNEKSLAQQPDLRLTVRLDQSYINGVTSLPGAEVFLNDEIKYKFEADLKTPAGPGWMMYIFTLVDEETDDVLDSKVLVAPFNQATVPYSVELKHVVQDPNIEFATRCQILDDQSVTHFFQSLYWYIARFAKWN